MKKKALWKDIVKEIWKSKARFLSIFSIILLGVAFYAGITATGSDMIDTAEEYYKENKLMDIKVQSTLGLTSDDIDSLPVSEEDEVRSYHTKDSVFKNTGLVTKLIGSSVNDEETINQPVIVEGRMPSKSGEIALDSLEEYQENYKIGDEVAIELEDEDDADSLKRDSFKVVGFVASPKYVETTSRGNTTVGSGTLDGFAFIPEKDLDLDAYTEIDIRFAETDKLPAYSEEYKTFRKKKEEAVEKSLEGRPQERKDEVRQKIQEGIDEGKEEIASAKEKLQDAQQELEDAKKELEEGRAEYELNKADFNEKIAQGQKTIDEKKAELEKAQAELDKQKANLNQAQAEFNDKKAEFNKERRAAEQQLAAGEEFVKNTRSITRYPKNTIARKTEQTLLAEAKEMNKDLVDLLQGYFDGEIPPVYVTKGLNQAADQLAASRADAEKQLKEAQTQLAQGQKEITEGRKQVEAGKQQIEDGKETLKKEQAKLNKQKEKLNQQKKVAEKQLSRFSDKVKSVVTYPKNKVSKEKKEKALSTAKQLDEKTSSLVQGYLEGNVPTSAYVDQLAEIKKQVNGLPEKMEELKNAEVKISKNQQELDKESKEVSNQLKTLEKQKPALSEQQAALKKEKVALEQDKKEAADKLAAQDKTLTNIRDVSRYPKERIDSSTREKLLKESKETGNEAITDLLQGYFDGTVTASAVQKEVSSIEQTAADKPDEEREQLMAFVEAARKAVTKPSSQVSKDKQTELIKKGTAIDSELGSALAAYFNNESPAASVKRAIEQAAAKVEEKRTELNQIQKKIAEKQSAIDKNQQELNKLNESEKKLREKKAALEQQQSALNKEKKKVSAQKAAVEETLKRGEPFVKAADSIIVYPKENISEKTRKDLTAEANKIDDNLVKLLEGYFNGQIPAVKFNELLDEAVSSVASSPELKKAEQALSEGQAEIDANKNKLEKNEAELKEKNKELQQAQATLNQKKKELQQQKAEAKSQIRNSAALISNAQSIVDYPKNQISNQVQERLKTSAKQIDPDLVELLNGYFDGSIPAVYVTEALDQTASELSTARSEANEQFNQAAKQLAAGQQEIKEGREQIEAAQKEISSGRAQLNNAQQELNIQKEKGQSKLAAAKKELEEGQADYEEGLAEFKKEKADAEEEIADGEADIEEAEDKLKDVPLPDYFVLDRTDNPGYAEYQDNADRISAISKIFPIFFFLIAALVSLTTMTRMVDEQRGQIGTLKALGYSNWDISKKFLVYSLLASVVGASLGLVIGFYLFPKVIAGAYGAMYNFPPVNILFPTPIIIIAYIVAFLCTGGAAYAAVRVSLRSNAAKLMRPKAPKVGKRILLERMTPIWSKMSFTQKVTARNLFRYKQRMLMTIAGVAGCTALILTGLGLSDSIADIADLQYGKLHQYQAMVALDDTASDRNKEKYEQFINETAEVDNAMLVAQENGTVDKKGVNQQEVNLFVPNNPDRIGSFIQLDDRKSGKDFTLDSSGAIITEKLASLLDLEKGDSLTIMNSDKEEYEVKVKEITENYLSHYIY
ncbi:MAG: FtsX-like permease family protein, partial [Pisciglobus halotolerans]|nr:FtsX-like permease family protein [Pisciglobus halotolerans]